MGRIIVIGGGIAGVATAAGLAERGREVLVVEQCAQLGTQSTARSAAIFRLAVEEPVNVRLALRSREIGRELLPGGAVTTLGGLYPCEDAETFRAILEAGRGAGVREATTADRPALLAHRDRPALYSPEDSVIDTHALLHALAMAARRSGAAFRFNTTIKALVFAAGKVSGIRTSEGEELGAEWVVDATGAWSGHVKGVPRVGVAPALRHLFVLDTPVVKAFSGVVWDLTDGVYLRPESGGLLVSPCDEQPMQPALEVPPSRDAAALLFSKLERWAPALSSATVRNAWAGLRPLTTDHRFVVGPDPRTSGLFHVGGFGGHGMTAGPAAGELAAVWLCDGAPAGAAELSPRSLD